MDGSWCLIESDPGLFTELLWEWGCKDAQVEEIYSLDDDTLQRLQPIYGLIFLFKWESRKDRPMMQGHYDPEANQNVFFAHQVIDNACATHALLSVVLNSPLEMGDTLKEFKTFTHDFPPDMKGLAVSNSEVIRSVHNKFARLEQFINEGPKKGEKKEDAFHFVSYVPFNGTLYELDGLQESPISHGPCTKENWVNQLRPILQERMESYQTSGNSEIRFSLMAVIKNKLQVYQEEIKGIEKSMGEARKNPSLAGPQGLERYLANQLNRKAECSMLMMQEEAKFDNYRKENNRRKHNFIPLMYTLLKEMARKNLLETAMQSASSQQKK